MRKRLIPILPAVHALAGCAAAPDRRGEPMPVADEAPWDATRVTRTVDAAREAHRHGDLAAAERLCYTTFLTVDRHALEGLDTYAGLLEADHRPAARDARAHAVRPREIKASQMNGIEPASAYLGFFPSDALNSHAELLQALARPRESQRMRSLAAAYQQVQQAHLERTLLDRQEMDPRGTC